MAKKTKRNGKKRGPGRPKGSKNKTKKAKATTGKKRGRKKANGNVAKKLLKDARALYKATQKEHNKLFFAMEKLEAKARALRAKADAKMDELMQLSEIIDKFQAKRNRKSKAKSKK